MCVYLVDIQETVLYVIYTLAFPFDLRCESVTYIYIHCKSAKVRVKNVNVKKYLCSQDSYVLQCILLKTFVRLMFTVLAIRKLFSTVNFCRFTVYISVYIYIYIYIYCIYICIPLLAMRNLYEVLPAN